VITKQRKNKKQKQTNKKKKEKKRTRLNEKGEKREQHEFGDNLCFFSVDKLYIKNILTLLKKYIIGLGNIQKKRKKRKKRVKWVEKLLVTFNLIFISCGNNYLTPEREKNTSPFLNSLVPGKHISSP